MTNTNESYPICKRDGFPMLKINGRIQCVVEYLDCCIGQQTVVDLIKLGKTTYYVFENQHKLPILCSCCGEPIEYKNLNKSRNEMCGRRLESMAIFPVKQIDGKIIPQFRLEFSKRGWLSRRTWTEVPFEVAIGLRHPADCPHRGSSKAKIRRRKKKVGNLSNA